MKLPERVAIEDLSQFDAAATRVWATASVADRARAALKFQVVGSLEQIEHENWAGTLIAVGGGTLIDEAKAWRRKRAPRARLIAIPSIWGSGAEVSPIVVLNRDGRKEIDKDDAYLPDATSLLPELIETIPERLVRDACGDVWTHALEGFLSPLAGDDLREELALVIGRLLEIRPARDIEWFELSARACAGQARSSVGLAHGISHTLEGKLRADPAAGAGKGSEWSHARLCSIFLWPVLRFNQRQSEKFDRLMGDYRIDGEAVIESARGFYDEEAFAPALAALEQSWREVLRDPCTRTNSALVRPGHLAFFTERGFQ